jgi:hypothetical protein
MGKVTGALSVEDLIAYSDCIEELWKDDSSY